MTEDERYDIEDLLPKDMILWDGDDELAWATESGFDYAYWRGALGHPKAHPGCCKTCGCATSCNLAVFYDGVVSSVIRELDKVGALRQPQSPAPSAPVHETDERGEMA